MKKFFIMIVAILLLAACGSKGVSQEDKQVTDKGVKEEETSAEIKKDESDAGKASKSVDATEEEAEPAEPEYVLNKETFVLAPIGEANPQVALLTIDDAPDNHALEMAHTLKKLDAPAIFFVNGHFINSPEKEKIVKEIYDLGFAIGNHTYSHDDLTTLTPEKQKEEIISVNEIVEKITGEKPKFFRAPFGKNTDNSKKIIKDEGMLLMNWTYGYDWEKDYMSGDAIVDIMVNTPLLQDGANLLMHDREWTNEGLERIVEGLRDKDYEILDPDLIDVDEN